MNRISASNLGIIRDLCDSSQHCKSLESLSKPVDPWLDSKWATIGNDMDGEE